MENSAPDLPPALRIGPEHPFTAWNSGPVVWGWGRLSVAAGPGEIQVADAAGVLNRLREAGAVLARIPADGELSAWLGACALQGFPALVDFTGSSTPISLAPPILSQASAVLVTTGQIDGEALRSLPASAAVFVLGDGEGARPWFEALEAVKRSGRPVVAVAGVRDLAQLPRWAREFNLPLAVLAAPELALAAAAAGAQGLILEGGMANDWEGLLGDLKGLSSLLDREMPRIPKRAEGLTSRGGAHDAESTVKVAFQGELGAYSEMAVYQFFDKGRTTVLPCKTFREVYEAVLKGEVDYAALPLENALAGSINDNYDLVIQYPDLHIVGETQVRIEHNLIGIPGTPLSQIKKVFSHPQGLAQSQAFLQSHPEWEPVTFYDTAGSVAHVAATGDPSLAAIASAEAARVYKMEILQAGVETNHRNFTRFALLAPGSTPARGEANKASVVFSTADSPGALSRCLALLAHHGLNMKRLESRPIHGKPWAYMFFVDVEVAADQGAFRAAVAQLEAEAEDFRVLGVYRSASPGG